MAIPPASALLVNVIPFSRIITPAEFNAGTFSDGVAGEAWFKYITATKILFGGFTTANPPADFAARTTVYQSDGVTQIRNTNASGDASFGWYLQLNAGTYYVRIRNQYGTPIALNFTQSFETKPLLLPGTIPPGSIVINDDTYDNTGILKFPGTVIGPSGTFLGGIEDLPPGEVGAILPTGESLWFDPFHIRHATKELALYDSTFTYVNSYDTLFGIGLLNALICASGVDFYIWAQTDRVVYKLTTSGVVTAVTAPLSVAVKSALGVNRNGTTLYYANGRFDGILYKLDVGTGIVTNLFTVAGWVPGDDIFALTLTNFNSGEILILNDNSIVTWYYIKATNKSHLIHLASDGTLLNDIIFDIPTDGLIDHIAYDINGNSNKITLWMQDLSFLSYGTWYTLDLTTGIKTKIYPLTGSQIVLMSASLALVEGINVKFSPSESCMMVTYLTAVTPPPITPPNVNSGIYKIVPGKRNDTLWNQDFTGTTDVKIPNPTARTGYI